MADTTILRIALQSARELEIEVDDPKTAKDTIESGFKDGEKVVWVLDSRGHQFGLVVDKLAFVEIEGEAGRSSVGFGVVG